MRRLGRLIFGRFRTHWLVAKHLSAGATGPLVAFVATFALPVLGAVILDDQNFAIWALLSTIATLALSLDFGGNALLTSRYFSYPQTRLLAASSALSAAGALTLGLLACLAWIPYQHTSIGQAIPTNTAFAAIAAMSTSSAIRSVIAVISHAALIEGLFALRNAAIAGHAILASAITAGLLFYSHSFWSLPIGWMLSGFIVVPLVTIWWLRARGPAITQITTASPLNWRRFTGLRTLATVLSALLFNCDRWIVGALGGPALLSAYEIAWRFAGLPRFLAQNLVVRVSADVAPLHRENNYEFHQIVRQSTMIAFIAGFLACVPVAACYWAFISITNHQVNWIIFLAMMFTFTAFSVAAPLSLSGAALGHSWIDIPYALLALAITALSATLAANEGQPSIFIYGYFSAILSSLVFYMFYAPKLVHRSLQSRTVSPVTGSQ